MSDTIKYLTPTETSKVLGKFKNTRDKTMFYLMYLYGMRCSEVSRLRLSDLRLEDNRLFIRASKNGINRDNVLDKSAKKMLTNWLGERTKLLGKSKNKISTILFPSKKFGEITTTQFYRIFSDAAKDAKISIDRRHPHVFRHSIAVHMAESGVPVERVQSHLRHRKIDSTMVYFAITSKKMLENQVEDLSGHDIVKI